VPLFWTEDIASKDGRRLPYTEVRVGSLTLRFNGRFGSKLKEAVRHLQAQQAAAVQVGERVRLVQMDGCMAHIRGKIEEGIVEALDMKQAYGDSQLRPWATIRLADGSSSERCALPSDWFRHSDGVMEYRF
jgi:hypothetical protein